MKPPTSRNDGTPLPPLFKLTADRREDQNTPAGLSAVER